MAHLLGMGNPLLDISAVVPDEELTLWDAKPNDALMVMPETEAKYLPLYKQLVTKYKVDYVAGGATQNSIRVAQWMMQTEGATSYIGCIGKDDFGEQLKASCAKDGVKVAERGNVIFMCPCIFH
jgi:adenosine kinase